MKSAKRLTLYTTLSVLFIALIAAGMVMGVTFAAFSRSLTVNNSTPINTAQISAKLFTATASGDNYAVGSQVAGAAMLVDSPTTYAVKSESTIPVVLRATFSVYYTSDAAGTTFSLAAVEGTDYTVQICTTGAGVGNVTLSGSVTNKFAGWTKQTNGYYYYNAVVQGGQYVPFVIANRTVTTGNLRIAFHVEQAQYNYTSTNAGFIAEWGPKVGAWDVNSTGEVPLGSNSTVDGIAMDADHAKNNTVSFIPVAGTDGWVNAPIRSEDTSLTESNSILLPLIGAEGTTEFQIPVLTGTADNSYIKAYNNTRISMTTFAKIIPVLYQYKGDKWTSADVELNDILYSNGSGSNGSGGSIKINLVDSEWTDVSTLADPYLFTNVNTVGTTNQKIFVYNRIVQSTQYVNFLRNNVTITGLKEGILKSSVADGTYALHFNTEIMMLNEDSPDASLDPEFGRANNGIITYSDAVIDTAKLDALKAQLESPYNIWISSIQNSANYITAPSGTTMEYNSANLPIVKILSVDINSNISEATTKILKNLNGIKFTVSFKLPTITGVKFYTTSDYTSEILPGTYITTTQTIYAKAG